MKRFWEKVEKTDTCWIWTACARGSYGGFKYNKKTVLAHRMSWFLTYGKFPDLLVCHSCDNRKCVNPQHLFLGTQKDNMQDCSRKNRVFRGGPNHPAKGEQSGQAKLTEIEVLDIRKRRENGMTYKEAGSIYGLDRFRVRSIIKRDWRHLNK